MRHATRLLLAILVTTASAAFADVWDVSVTDNDNSSGTDNELVHGGRQVHDLGAAVLIPDQDWYKVTSFPKSSHEVLVDGTTGDLGPGLTLERVTAGGTVLQSSVPIAGGSGDSRSLRWINGTTAVATEFVRVANAACGSLCSAVDQYSVRYYETSGAMVRFNNNATQVTVLQIQNPSSYTINGEVYFWSAGRVLLGTSPFQLTGKGQTVVNTATIAPGVSGHLTLVHDGRYGDLNAIAVALEPATGFSFSYGMVVRPD